MVWNHGTLWLSHHVGNVIIPTDELIFFRGVGIPPTVICWFLQFVSLQEDLRSLDWKVMSLSSYAVLNSQDRLTQRCPTKTVVISCNIDIHYSHDGCIKFVVFQLERTNDQSDIMNHSGHYDLAWVVESHWYPLISSMWIFFSSSLWCLLICTYIPYIVPSICY